jgi:hypothetical protein
MNCRTLSLTIAGLLMAAATAQAASVPDVLGTWQGTHEDMDPANSNYGLVNPMLFIVQSQTGSTISGEWDWLSGDAAGCPRTPCTTTWSGSISAGGELSLTGEFGYDYLGGLVGNTIAGTFTSPPEAGNPGYGTWTASMARAPEIDTRSAASALTLLLGGLVVLTGRRKALTAA